MNRLISLDGLRAVAVLLVIGRHVHPSPEAPTFLHVWQRGGWIGVDLFFVLSGFLVSGLLFREFQRSGAVQVGRFLIRRGLKIYPAFYAFLALTMAGMMIQARYLAPSQIAGEVLFFQNYLGGVWNHTWSLAVEEHFYIAVAVLIAAMIRAKANFRWIPRGFAVLAVGLLLLRLWNAQSPYNHMTHLFPTHLRADSLGFGVVLSYYWHFQHDRFLELRPARWLMLALGIGLLAPAFLFPLDTTPAIYTVGLTAFYMGSGLILASLLLLDFPQNPLTRGLAFVGSNSYSIYLWHMPVIVWLLPRTSNPILMVSFAIFLSVVVGVVAARVVEIPVLRLRDRMFPSTQLLNHPVQNPERAIP